MSPATLLYLLRHGEVDAAWQGRIYGALDIPLSPQGRLEAERSARELDGIELRAVVSSGLARTEFGAAALRSTRALPRQDDRELRELERGRWAGRSVSELEELEPEAWRSWFRAPSRIRPPGGENLEDLANRAVPRIRHWTGVGRGGAIAIITHGWVVRVLVCHALRASLDLAPRIDIRTGDITLLRARPATRSTDLGLELELAALAIDQHSAQLSG